jgi:hypothetical protein
VLVLVLVLVLALGSAIADASAGWASYGTRPADARANAGQVEPAGRSAAFAMMDG